MFAIGPGKKDVNIIWAGSDDGVVHVTRDGGKTWANVTPKDMPDLGRVSQIDASAFDPGAAYVAVKKPLLDDLAPYIFRTHDFGQTWTKIVDRHPAERLRARRARGSDASRAALRRHAARRLRVVRRRRSLGAAVAEPAGHADVGSDRRGQLARDRDARPRLLHPRRHRAAAAVRGGCQRPAADAFLFKPADAIRSTTGATIAYLLKKPAQKLTLDILDARGQVVRTFAGRRSDRPRRGGRGEDDAAPRRRRSGRCRSNAKLRHAGRSRGEPGCAAGGGRGRGGAPTAPMVAGLNRFTWDLRYAPATSFPGMVLWGGSVDGPAALARHLSGAPDGRRQAADPAARREAPSAALATDADLKEQFDLAIQIRDKVERGQQRGRSRSAA